MNQIYFVHAEGCTDCEEMQRHIDKALEGVPDDSYGFKKIHCDDDEALELAIAYGGVDEIPFLIINDMVFLSEDVNGPDIISELLVV